MFKNGLVLAIESENVDAGGADDAVEAAETATEVEAGSAEVEKTADTVDDVDTAIGNSVDAAEGLGEVQEEVQASVDSGEGLTAREAKFAEMAVEAYCRRAGIRARDERIFPSMENFGSRHGRLTASKVVLEGIGDAIKRIWEAIKAAAAKVWDFIKSLFTGLTKNRESLAKMLKNLKQRLEDLPTSAKPKEDKFKTGAAEFTIGSKASPDNVLTILTSSVVFLGAVPAALTALNDLVTTAHGQGEIKDNAAPLLEPFAKLSMAVGDTVDKKSKGDKDTVVQYHGNLLRGQSLVSKITKKKTKELVSYSVEEVAKSLASEIKAPSVAEMENILDAADKALTALKSVDRVMPVADKALKTLARHADEMIKIAGEGKAATLDKKDDAAEAKDDAGETAEQARSLVRCVSTLAAAAPKMAFGAIKASADYVSAGINNMSSKDKEKK